MKKIFSSLIFVLIIHCTLITDNCRCQWVNYPLPYDGLAYTLGFYNVNIGVSCGYILYGGEKIYYTSNSGGNWVLASYPQEINSLVDIQFINSTTVYACGYEPVYNNNSKIFLPSIDYLPVILKNRFNPKSIDEMYSDSKTAFLKSTNSGISWVKAGVSGTLTGYMNNIHFFDASTGYALIDTGSIRNTGFYKTTNAGENWQMIKYIEGGIDLDNMYFFDLNTGFVGGYKYSNGMTDVYGVIYKTTNGGLSFVKTSFSRNSQIKDFTFLNSTTGIAIGTVNPGATNIYRTTNAGNQWDSVSYLPDRIMLNIESIQATGTAFVIGNVLDTINGFGKISTAKTTNYGTNWVLKDINQISLVTGLSLIDQNNFMMSGGDLSSSPSFARIFKSTNGGNVFVNQVGSELPSSYSLYQNYPNPFNPSTKIKFDIKKSVVSSQYSVVILKVFDILGKEVATLVNEKLQPGTYEVTFDGLQYTSGIYFYKLQSDGFSESKKMLMIK
jgi:hypothetical protein